MTTRVQMLQTRQGDAGATLTAGQQYDLRDDLANDFIGVGLAVEVNNSQNREGAQPVAWSDKVRTPD